MLAILIGLACIGVICIGCQKSKGFRTFITIVGLFVALIIVAFIVAIIFGG